MTWTYITPWASEWVYVYAPSLLNKKFSTIKIIAAAAVVVLWRHFTVKRKQYIYKMWKDERKKSAFGLFFHHQANQWNWKWTEADKEAKKNRSMRQILNYIFIYDRIALTLTHTHKQNSPFNQITFMVYKRVNCVAVYNLVSHSK